MSNAPKSNLIQAVGWLVLALALFALVAFGLEAVRGAAVGDAIPLRVELGARSITKAPFLIAADQGLFDKYGVKVDLRMPPPDFGDARGQRTLLTRAVDVVLSRSLRGEVYSNGIMPDMVEMATNLAARRMRAIASTDCVARFQIIGRHGLRSVEELKGKRIGITGLLHNNTGYVALELAKRMKWDPVHDISIVLNGRDIKALRDGRVDAIVASEREYAQALDGNFPVLLDARTWDLPIGGNSAQVEVKWLEDARHREAARRFLKALVEGIAIFHENRELTIDVLQRWNGAPRRHAEVMYDQSAIPRKPYPCYDGIRRTFEVYDSHALRAYRPEDFYDDTFIKELDEGGFIDSVYAAVKAAQSRR